MRQAFEMTFGSSEFRVLTAGDAESALRIAGEQHPDVIFADVSMTPSGYDLCRRLKEAGVMAPVVLLSSKHHPFDAALASSVRADDHVDKPFDTQALLEKITMLLSARGMSMPVRGAMSVAPTLNPTAITPAGITPTGLNPSSPAPKAVGAGGQVQVVAQASVPAQAQSGRPTASSLPPAARSSVPAARTTGAPAAATSAQALPAELRSRLAGLGLSEAQLTAVVSLTRDVVERAVWEIVPPLAESMIKEEIDRLMREG